MDTIETILQKIAWKRALLLQKGLDPKGILLSASDYQTLKDEHNQKTGSSANPDRLMGLPLYSIDEEKASTRTGQPKEPMLII